VGFKTDEFFFLKKSSPFSNADRLHAKVCPWRSTGMVRWFALPVDIRYDTWHFIYEIYIYEENDTFI
jgi:hypothetical protein